MDRITRKELKQDKFALEVEHTVEYVTEHKKQVVRYAVIGGAVVLLIVLITLYRSHEHKMRTEALAAALRVTDSPIGPAREDGGLSFPTLADRSKAAVKAYSQVASEYPKSDEGAVASYYLGTIAADAGNLAEAEKNLNSAIEAGNAKYASLAKLSLAEICQSQGKTEEAEKLYRSLMDKPTVFVSKEQATIALAKLIARTRPNEARKLLEPLSTARPAISRAAMMALSELQGK